MGAYQSAPVTDCESTDAENERIRFGASSMQGWRRSQEDALNICPDFDVENESMLFAVYDGHGGSEVAEYCSQNLPKFIKQLKEYQDADMEKALITAFIEFDRTLTADETVLQLQDLAKRPASPLPSSILRLAKNQAAEQDEDECSDDTDCSNAQVDCDEDEAAELLEDASLPVDKVLQRLSYTKVIDAAVKQDKGGLGQASNTGTTPTVGDTSLQTGTLHGNSDSPAGSSSQSTAKLSTISAEVVDIQDGSGSESENSVEQYPENGDESSDDDGDEDDLDEMRASQELALKFTESEDYLDLPGSDSGCTACLALLRGDKLYVANAGDSRCVLSRGGKAIDLSVDHKPEDDAEKERIDHAGGFVTPDGRVNGNLNLSRAIGDHNYKRNTKCDLKEQMITALPDVQSETLTALDEFIVIACDGIWNSLSSQECVDFVKDRIFKGEKLSKICEDLFHSVLADDTVDGDGTGCDNMTCIIIDLQKSTRPDPKNHRTNSTGFDHTICEEINKNEQQLKSQTGNQPGEPNTKRLKSE